jgi:hypothetical protein
VAGGEAAHPEAAARLKAYWVAGKGRELWVHDPHPWTALYHHLLKFMNPDEAKRTAAQWFHDALGYWPGDQKGSNPKGPG